MKIRYLLSVLLILIGWFGPVRTALGCAPASSSHRPASQVNSGYLPHSNYLVIGVFAYQDNAESFSGYAQSQGLSAQYGYYPSRGYYYVYTFASDSAGRVIERCLQLRASSEFEDAWVFRAYEKDDADGGVPEINAPAGEIAESNAIRSVDQQTLADDRPTAVVDRQLSPSVTEPGHPVYFRTIDEEQQPVTAVVKVVDGVRAQEIKQCSAHQPEVLEYNRLSDQVQLITYAIGYRKTTFDLPLDQPVNDSTASYVAMSNDTIRVTMPLEKLKKGDVQAMFNTYFYGNSSVMRERSRYELEELQRFLHANPTIKIMLHGHTNGHSRGIVYLYSEEHGNFFNVRRSNEYKKNGVSSMKLSKLRAETIRQYLIKQGIAEDRIETKGWGGKKMLYEADSPLAKHNIRVEIEVLEE